MVPTSDPSAMTAALFHLACATLLAFVLCSWILWLTVLLAMRRFRGAVKCAEGVPRSGIENT